MAIPAPNKVWVQLTNACNVNCVHCLPESRYCRPDELTNDQILAIIDDCAALGTRWISFTGGEPLLHRGLDHFLKRASSHGMRVHIETSASILDRNRLADLKKCGLSILGLSLDGDAMIHDRIRGVPQLYGKVISALQDAYDLDIRARIFCVVTRDNHEVAKRLPLILQAELAQKLSIVDVLLYGYLTPFGRATALMSLNPRQWIAFCDAIDILRSEFKGELDIKCERAFIKPGEVDEYQRRIPTDIFCMARGRDWIYVSSDGRVYGCVTLVGSDASLGDVKSDALSKIWLESVEWKFFDPLPVVHEHGSCGGGCPAFAYRAHGERGHSDERCTDAGQELLPICPLAQFPQLEPWPYERTAVRYVNGVVVRS